jgi:hypothetical protein
VKTEKEIRKERCYNTVGCKEIIYFDGEKYYELKPHTCKRKWVLED